ncbi:MAG: site-2 protease family protein [Candidatus Promineifilaceae bacterium]
MFKNASLKLFSVRGIDIRLHFTFPLILLWAALEFGLFLGGGWSGAVFGVIAISLLFVVVTLHELGHSFAAMRYNVPVERIVLSPIGGIAQLRRMPEDPKQEFVVAIAGPAVNFVIAVILGVFVLGFGIHLVNPFVALGRFSLTALFSYLFISNIFLALFNLIPAFPMDGGRVLRALLAMRLEYGRATKIAATIGRGFAILLGIYGFFGGGIFLMVIAFFLYTMAGQESAAVQVSRALKGYTVQQAYNSSVHRLHPDHTLQHAANMMLYSGQDTLPVTQDGRFVGIVTQRQVFELLEARGPNTLVGQIMKQDVAPVSLQSEITAVQRRFVEENVTALPVVGNGDFLLGLITRRHIAELYRMLSATPQIIHGVQSA